MHGGWIDTGLDSLPPRRRRHRNDAEGGRVGGGVAQDLFDAEQARRRNADDGDVGLVVGGWGHGNLASVSTGLPVSGSTKSSEIIRDPHRNSRWFHCATSSPGHTSKGKYVTSTVRSASRS